MIVDGGKIIFLSLPVCEKQQTENQLCFLLGVVSFNRWKYNRVEECSDKLWRTYSTAKKRKT